MSEFKIAGIGYVSQWNGNASNPGTDTSPKAHPSNAGMPGDFTNQIIIGPGYYIGSIPGGSAARRWTGDGEVIIDLNGGSIDTIPVNPRVIFTNLTIKNGSVNALQSSGYETVNLRLINGIIWKLRFTSLHTGFLLIGDVSNNDPSGADSFIGCSFLGSVFSNNLSVSNGTIVSSFLAKGKSIILPNYTNRSNFRNNCLNGVIIVAGIQYELKLLFDGSARPDADPSVFDLASIWPDIYSFPRNNFSGDPKFIDEYNRIVSSDSVLLSRQDITTIGSVKPGKSIPVNSSDSDVTITTTNIDTSNPTNWVIQSPETSGTIKILWKLSDNISEIQRLLLDALLSFDGSVAGGTVGNNNVPDIFPTAYTPLSQVGLKPNRLTYALRTSQSISKPLITAEWDNDNVTLGTTVGAFYIQEWNTKPTIVTALGVRYGNGNPESIGGVSNGINARWAEAEIRLTNNRSF